MLYSQFILAKRASRGCLDSSPFRAEDSQERGSVVIPVGRECSWSASLVVSQRLSSNCSLKLWSLVVVSWSWRVGCGELVGQLSSAWSQGVIDVLVNNGKQIDAVNLAYAFELTEEFSPISLPKMYLSEAKKVSSPAKPGNASVGVSAQNDMNEKELTTLKAVIRCIEDHKLEEQFPVDPLQKQVVEIKKAKSDRKRATEVANMDKSRISS
ncbi:hypothetical protein ACS0TY_014293 [Phlomoides rotata]